VSALTATVTPDAPTGALVVDIDGELDESTAPIVRATLVRCFAECPSAIVVDLSRAQADQRSALTVFPAVQRHSPQAAYVALMLCAPGGPLIGRLSPAALGRYQMVYTSCAAALASVGAGPVGREQRQLRLVPDFCAPGAARHFVADTCRSWDLGHLLPSAELIGSELVSNGVRHAGTDLDLMLSRRGPYLHIGVRDTDPALPRMAAGGPGPQGGRGLRLIERHASSWGTSVSGSGKIVWANLDAEPPQ
jgi:anti-anti-sigma regulatory factor